MQIAIGDENGAIDVPVLNMQTEVNAGALSLDADIRAQQGVHVAGFTRTESVRLATLDSFNLPAAHLIKVDVEGLELEVLSGAQQWIERSGHPPILFEVWGDYMPGLIAKRHRLLTLLQETLGYEVKFHGELGIAQHPLNKRLNITEQGMEIHRFI